MIRVVTPPVVLGTTLITSFYGEIKKAYEGYPMWTLISGGWMVVVRILILSFILMKTKGKGEEPE